MAGSTKYWFNGLPLDGLTGSAAGASRYWFNGLPYDVVAAAAGSSGINGVATITQAGDTVSTAATILIQATTSAEQAGDAVSASGVVPAAAGVLTATQEGDTVAATASNLVAAVLIATASGDSASISGTVRVSADLTATQGGDTVSGTIGLVSNAQGQLDLTQDANTGSAAGVVAVKGTASLSQDGNTVSAAGTLPVKASAALAQAGDTIAAAGSPLPYVAANLVQDANTASASGTVLVQGALDATQGNNTAPPPEIVVAAPSYSTWAKRQNKNKPQAPTLPPPVEAGEIVIDEAVLRQMEEERLAALVLQRKTEALDRVEDLRAYAPAERRPTRSVTIDPRRFDVVGTTPEVRTRVISLFREQPKPALVEPVRGSITLRALGPRHLPEPEIRNARTISLRRAPHRTMQTGL